MIGGYSVLVVALAVMAGGSWEVAGGYRGAAVDKTGWKNVGVVSEAARLGGTAAAETEKTDATAASCLIAQTACVAGLHQALRQDVCCSVCRNRDCRWRWGGIGVGLGAVTGVDVMAATAQWQPQHSGRYSTVAGTV